MSTWIPVNDTDDAELGVRYRTSVPLAAWTFPIVNISGVQAALAVGKKIAGDRVRIIRHEIFAPGTAPTDWVARGFRPSDWGVRVTWEKTGSGTPILVYAGAIAGVIAVATLSWLVVAKFTEKEFREFNEEIRTTGDKFKDFLKDTLFNPGVIISAVVGIALITRRRR